MTSHFKIRKFFHSFCLKTYKRSFYNKNKDKRNYPNFRAISALGGIITHIVEKSFLKKRFDLKKKYIATLRYVTALQPSTTKNLLKDEI